MICMFKAIRYCQQMYLTIFGMCLKRHILRKLLNTTADNTVILLIFCLDHLLSDALKKTVIKSDLLTDIDMLLMAEKKCQRQNKSCN